MSVPDDPELAILLPIHALGALDDADAARVARAVAADPAVGAELAVWRAVAATLGTTLAPVAPAMLTRARLLARLRDGADRVAERLARLFDLPFADARAALAAVDDDARWARTLPGIDLLQVAAGPAAAGADCGLLRIAAGTRFPWHAHVGEETTLVLRGGAILSDGRRMTPGDELVAGPGDEHDFVVDDGEACVLAVRARGVRFKRRPAGRDADPAGAD